MRIGIPAEVKDKETRVAATPAGVHALVGDGHTVIVQRGAGMGSSFTDADYVAAGATLGTVDEAWGCELVLKVKEPIASEYHQLRADLLLFTYLHLASAQPLVEALVQAGTTAIAYETVELDGGALPLLAPMSEVAGRMSVAVGAHYLQSSQGGRGVLLGGVPGVAAAEVVVLGAGVAGSNAIAQAVGMGAEVTVIDLSLPRLRQLDAMYAGRVRTIASSPYEIEKAAMAADLVIGAVLVTGDRAPHLISRELVSRMKPGSVLVDIAIDQGGCFEDSRATTHSEPVYEVGDSTFYCVANMPGAVGNTSTLALTNATLPYARALAAKGWQDATAADPALARGLATVSGSIVHAPTAALFPHLA